ncbi:hypothetical protein EV178_006173 [Coemansia sp. RSA 1646]|nr:hypothetical protein EV178_006173 [Coemansia sp. RSA 1646]KAJ2085748.1 hypothetical protein IW138_006143 [Coemansia sp. RSA 986]
MRKRSHSRNNGDTGDGDRSDFIHVGTEFTLPKKNSKRQRLDVEQTEWKPTISFVSSRGKRAERLTLRPEDFMDAQDMADDALIAGDQTAGPSTGDGGPFTSSAIDRAPGSVWHGVGYGIDIASLAISDTANGPTPLPTFGTLFKRKIPQPKKNKKPAKNKRLLSFVSVFDDEDDDEESGYHYGSTKGGLLSKPNDTHVLTALEKLAKEKGKPEPAETHGVFGFVFVHLLETEQHCVYEGPKVPATFTGPHKPSRSRWDTVPATGSQSQLPNGHGNKEPRKALVTAVDRAKLRIVDDSAAAIATQQDQMAFLDANVAKAALENGFMPFVGEPQKQQRYKEFLKATVAVASQDVLTAGSITPTGSSKETKEFARIAQAFQPNTTMLSRFTRSTQQTDANSPGACKDNARQVTVDTKKGARKHSSRTVVEWAPSRLLCKRMGVPPPPTAIPHAPRHPSNPAAQQAPGRKRAADFIDWGSNGSAVVAPMVVASEQNIAEPTERPDMALFQAIFGDSK